MEFASISVKVAPGDVAGSEKAYTVSDSAMSMYVKPRTVAGETDPSDVMLGEFGGSSMMVNRPFCWTIRLFLIEFSFSTDVCTRYSVLLTYPISSGKDVGRLDGCLSSDFIAAVSSLGSIALPGFTCFSVAALRRDAADQPTCPPQFRICTRFITTCSNFSFSFVSA